MVRLFVLTAFGQNSKNAKEVQNFAKYEINAKNLHGLKILAKRRNFGVSGLTDPAKFDTDLNLGTLGTLKSFRIVVSSYI